MSPETFDLLDFAPDSGASLQQRKQCLQTQILLPDFLTSGNEADSVQTYQKC